MNSYEFIFDEFIASDKFFFSGRLEEGSRKFVALHTDTHTNRHRVGLLIHTKPPQVFRVTSFEVLRQEDLLVLCCASKTLGVFKMLCLRLMHTFLGLGISFAVAFGI